MSSVKHIDWGGDNDYKNAMGTSLGSNIIQPMAPPPVLFNPADPYGINTPITPLPIQSTNNSSTDMSNSATCNFGICINNVPSPVCSQQVSDNINAAWERTISNVDNIIMGVPSPKTNNATGKPTAAQQTQKATNNAYYVMGGAVVFLVIAGVVVHKVFFKKH